MAFKLNTVLLLMAEHGKTVIPLNDVCEKYLGLNPQTANYRASTHQLPFNTFRVGQTTRAPRMVHIEDLAQYIEKQQEASLKEWEKMNC